VLEALSARETPLTVIVPIHYTAAMNRVDSIAEPSRLRRAAVRIYSRIKYIRFERECRARPAPTVGEASSPRVEEELNERMWAYPHNHSYRIVRGRIVPGFRLYERLQLVAKAYPEPLHSFLDIGCCRGFYVLDAAGRLGCPRAVGIDVHEPFVGTARDAARYLSMEGAAFHCASLEQVSANPQEFGGPFQVVLLIGTYHYLFWGSTLCPTAYYSHEEIFRRLASICTDRLIISGRITRDRLVRIQEELQDRPCDVPYTAEAFLEGAGKFFQVRHVGHLGVDPLFVMSRTAGAAGEKLLSSESVRTC
jgi:SAM-dependent methyltransferase